MIVVMSFCDGSSRKKITAWVWLLKSVRGEIRTSLASSMSCTVRMVPLEHSQDQHQQPVALLCPSRHHPEKGAAHAAEQERGDVREARQSWFDAQPDLDPDRLVFLDETAATTAMARRYGRSPRGERCRM